MKMWLILLWIKLLFMLLVSRGLAQNAPLQSTAGVYFDEIGNLYLSPTQWKFINYIDLNPIKGLWKQTKSHQRQVLNICHKYTNETWFFLTDCAPFETYSIPKIKYVDSLQDIITGYLNEKTRRKRGVLDFMGEISKVLFGTATESEIKEYQHHIEKIENEQKEFLKISTEQMTVIKSAILTFNSTIYRINQNERALAEGLQKFAEHASQAITNLEKITHAVEGLNEQLRQIQRGIDESQYSFDILVDAFIHAQDGVLQPHLVTPSKIKTYMDQDKPSEDLDFPPFPISELNKIIKPVIYSFKNYLVYVLQVPLISTTHFQLYKVLPFPKQITAETYMYIDSDKDYIFKDSLHHKYGKMTSIELSSCFKPNDISFVCKEKTPVFTYIPGADCEASLLHVSTDRIPDVCDKRIVKLTKTLWISLYLSNDWLYVTPKVERFAILCPGKPNSNIELINQGKLHMPSGCKGYSATATLFASSQIEVNRTDKDILPIISTQYDCCFEEELKTQLPELSLHTPLQNILSSVNDLRIASYKVSEVEDLIQKQHDKFYSKPFFQHGLGWITTLGIVITSLISICCCCCCCKCCRDCGFWIWDKWSPRECWEQTRSRCMIINTYQPVVTYDATKVSPESSPSPSVRSLPPNLQIVTDQPIKRVETETDLNVPTRPMARRSVRLSRTIR